MESTTPNLDSIKARRITGGAIVTVTHADGRVHRYRIGLRRYNRLLDTLVVHRGTAGGYFGRNGFECRIRDVGGLADARRWAARNVGSRHKHWRPTVHAAQSACP